MNDEQREKLKEFIRKHTEEICKTPESALAYLVKLGTHTPEGNLTPEYGGPPRTTDEKRMNNEELKRINDDKVHHSYTVIANIIRQENYRLYSARADGRWNDAFPSPIHKDLTTAFLQYTGAI